ncbi:MAG: hypothetical protein CMN30_12995 [Sandaracinus sp.]|nr:hypothetical protein [Sandaracinus sp.]|tara:strand:+ start:116 stop:1081 length:966 start_codon:yes stop_codon:yes gene_type:complete
MIVGPLSFRRVLPSLIRPALLFAFCAFLATGTHFILFHPDAWHLRPDIPNEIRRLLGWYRNGVPFEANAALGSALAIFLGFRNNFAYDRWWEARKIWGALVNDSRSWCRQVLAWVGRAAEDPERAAPLRAELVHRHLAFVHGLGMHLRNDSRLAQSIQRFLPADENYEHVPNVPTALLIRQGEEIATAQRHGLLDSFHQLAMDGILTRLSDIQGKCERIKNTPLPRQYDAIPRWFVYVYCCFLPFGLVENLGWATVVVCVIISTLFLLLESAGRVIEDPFETHPQDTPMTALSVTIERDLRFALSEPLPESLTPDETGVLM